MSRIHYFQRYSQKENWVTNSTLLLLSRLYYHSRIKFENVLNELLGDDNISLNIGVNFSQQEKGGASVVDGIVSQDSFQILIETKLFDNFNEDQLERHLSAFDKSKEEKVLLALSVNQVSLELRRKINGIIKSSQYKDVKFASCSFEEIITLIREILDTHDVEMLEILDDYETFCNEQNLIDYSNEVMLAVTTGASFEENIANNLYYNPSSRNHNRKFKYIGLYSNKTIQAIGEVVKTVCCDYIDGALVSPNGEELNLSDEEYERILNTINDVDYYDLTSGESFMLVDRFYQTNFKKASRYALQSKRYFLLSKLEGYKKDMTVEEIANLLDGKTWE